MYDVITIGTATRDVYLFSKKFRVMKDKYSITGQAECFAFGTKIELDDVLFEVGGGGTNTAYTFARQGFRVGTFAKVGKDQEGQEIIDFLKQHNITPFPVLHPKLSTAFSVIFLTATGERTILVYRGASHDIRASDVPFQQIKKAKWIYITSLSGALGVIKRVADFAKKNDIKLAVNFGKRELQYGLRKLLPIIRKTNILFLNREEASALLGVGYHDTRGLVRAMGKVQAGITVVTEGEHGSYASDGKNLYTARIKPVKAKDTTGAGDAFSSGFLVGIMRKRDIRYALQFGSMNAKADVLHIGAKHGALPRTVRIPVKDSARIMVVSIK